MYNMMTEVSAMSSNDDPTDSTNITDETSQHLAKGILEIYEPGLVTIKTHLKELTDIQESLHLALTTERRRLEDLSNDAVSDAIIANVALSRERLIGISNTMTSLHHRVKSLQIRAANIEKVARSRN